jgi:hypothetical protein
MHCKIRHFAQAEIQYSTDLFNRIDPEVPFEYRETGDHATGNAGAGLIQSRKTACVRLPPTDWARNPRQHSCAVDSRRYSRTAGSGVDGPTRLLKYAAAFACGSRHEGER